MQSHDTWLTSHCFVMVTKYFYLPTSDSLEGLYHFLLTSKNTMTANLDTMKVTQIMVGISEMEERRYNPVSWQRQMGVKLGN